MILFPDERSEAGKKSHWTDRFYDKSKKKKIIVDWGLIKFFYEKVNTIFY